MRYLAHNILAVAARPTFQLWRLALGMALICALYFTLGFAYFNLLAELVTVNEWSAFAREIDHGSTPRGMLALLASFGLLILSLSFVLRRLHFRTLASLLGPLPRAATDFARVSTALIALSVLLWMLPEPNAMTSDRNLPPLRWLSLLPLAVPLLMIQVSAEEMLFRGYLQSQLAARFSHPILWIIAPSILFGFLHFDPEVSGANAPALMLSATLFGLAAADLTARSGTLGPALALHFVINFNAILLIAPQDMLYGIALYTYPFTIDDTSVRSVWLPYDMMILLCSWLTARLALRR